MPILRQHRLDWNQESPESVNLVYYDRRWWWRSLPCKLLFTNFTLLYQLLSPMLLCSLLHERPEDHDSYLSKMPENRWIMPWRPRIHLKQNMKTFPIKFYWRFWNCFKSNSQSNWSDSKERGANKRNIRMFRSQMNGLFNVAFFQGQVQSQTEPFG